MESVCIMTATFEFHGSHLHVINVYAPTSAAKESQSDKFYKDLKKVSYFRPGCFGVPYSSIVSSWIACSSIGWSVGRSLIRAMWFGVVPSLAKSLNDILIVYVFYTSPATKFRIL
uniref:Uncharacterized protein n=1 Tax=Caenorhabditis japonica TaxID=281687 RepID=A0A8R1IQN7_CAEJA